MRMHKKEREAHLILEQHLPYYVELSFRDKAEFRKRVNLFIREMKFRGGKNFAIGYEHVVAVAGSAIQISFGNARYLLSTFSEVIIYEKVYQNPMTKNYHRGEVNPAAGIIVVSWEDFVYGYTTDEDNLNVGLHEMAHAYYFEIMKNREDYKNSYDLLSKFMFVSEYEILKIRKNRSTLFRDYAGENVFEFFAVSVEYFFEDGAEFREKLPKLYRQMCLLLNQDTADGIARGFDYGRYFERIFIAKSLPPKMKKDELPNKLQMRLMIKFSKLYFLGVIFSFITLVSLMAGNFVLLELMLFIDATIIVIIAVISLSLKVFSTDSHLYLTYLNLSGKQIFGIPLKGIVSVSMEKEIQGKYLITYRDEGVLKHFRVSTNSAQTRKNFEQLIVTNNIMLKMDGMRLARIKSHKNIR